MRAIKMAMKPEGGILIGSYNTVAGDILDELTEVKIQEFVESARGKAKPAYRGTVKRRRLDDGDDDDDDVAEQLPQEAEQGPNEPHALGTTRPWDLVVCDE